MGRTKGKTEKFDLAQLFGRAKQSLLREPDKAGSRRLLLYFAAISILEILAYTRQGIFSAAASRIWLFTGIFCLAAFCCQVGGRLAEDIKNRQYIVPAGFAILILIYCSFIGNIGYADINADAAQQVAAGLDSFSSRDWNYTGVAFLGYANRQYILAALPAALFGRSIATLHLGFALPFLIGLTMLFLELRSWLKREGLNEMLALIPAYALMAFRFIPEYFLNFEQAITPVALTMMGIALFMQLYRAPSVLGFLCLSWVGCLFCDSYTPVIASLGLLLCFLILYMLELFLKSRDFFGGRGIFGMLRKWSLGSNDSIRASEFPQAGKKGGRAVLLIRTTGGLAVNIICFFLATLLNSRSDRLNSFREDVDFLPFAAETWGEFFTDSNAVFLGIFSGLILLYLFLSLLGRLKFCDFTISCWTLGVVLFANLLAGYTAYEKAWILQRNMIVIPVLVTSIFLAIIRLIRRFGITVGRTMTACLVLFFTVMGLLNFRQEHQSFNYFRYIQPLKYMIAYTEDTLREYGVRDTEEFNLVLYTDNLLQSNLYDYAKFFYPKARVYSRKSGEPVEDLDWSLPTFLFGESEQELIDFGLEIEMRDWKNPRYRTTAVWYRSVKMD